MSDLIERCKEILAWKSTGVLSGNALRTLAETKWAGHHNAVQLAEGDTVNEALEALAAQPAQAGQVLTDEDMRDALRTCPHDTVENLRVRWLYAKDFARAIEQAVLAKRVPMTDAQINDAYGTARVQWDHIPHDDVARIIRAAERFHGIGEKA